MRNRKSLETITSSAQTKSQGIQLNERKMSFKGPVHVAIFIAGNIVIGFP